jgi:hypothetical protein
VRSLTNASGVALLLLTLQVTSCAPSAGPAPAPAATPHRALALIWHSGSHGPPGKVMVDLRSCALVLDANSVSPRSDHLEPSDCASLAKAADALPRSIESKDCGPTPAPVPARFEVAYDDGTTITGPRCTNDPRDNELFDALQRVARPR